MNPHMEFHVVGTQIVNLYIIMIDYYDETKNNNGMYRDPLQQKVGL